MPTAKSILGKKAEDLTVERYKRSGCSIVERNYHCRYGEIDIIAQDGGALVFVEVRSRRSCAMMPPAESVDARKIEKLLKTAKCYMCEKDLPEDTECRFDVAEVLFERGTPVTIEIYAGAFIEE